MRRRETGYVLGQNAAIEIRPAEGHYNRLVRAPAAGEKAGEGGGPGPASRGRNS